ncbi:MAG: hypothetical protein GYA55_00430 [SAR324 cluster bacterium]|uniref:Glycosyltransferase RgtA/B/C/D-like domain-containing protein n=1 Tax=SAR324 cluster bacterium TaxID=2024889 RepID=A0A7X9FNW4_9DELT|nr:hypothetical protein [SAR324 cluster bacterium]
MSSNRSNPIPKMSDLVAYTLAFSFLGYHLVDRWDFVPIWDAYNFYTYCYSDFALNNDLNCFSHISQAGTVIFGTFLKIFKSVNALYTLNFSTLLISTVLLREILTQLSPSKDTSLPATLSSLLLPLSPLVFVQVFQFSLDFPIIVATIIFLYFLLRDRIFLVTTVLGPILVLTKEPAIFIYCTAVFWYLFLLKYSGNPRWPSLRDLSQFVFPLIIFSLMALMNGLHTSEYGLTPSLLFHKIILGGILNYVALSQAVVLLSINFVWLLTIVIFFALTNFIGKILFHQTDLKNEFDHQKNYLFILMTCITLIFLTNLYVPFGNPRYVSSCFVFLIILFHMSAISIFRDRRILISYSFMTLILFGASFNRTFDPVSTSLFASHKFGDHFLLNVMQLKWRNPGRKVENCQDQFVYNFEFMKISDSFEYIVSVLGKDKTYAALTHPLYHINDPYEVICFNKMSNHREMCTGSSARINVKNLKDIQKVKDFYFIDLSIVRIVRNARELEKLMGNYYIEETMTLGVPGYEIPVYHVSRRNY